MTNVERLRAWADGHPSVRTVEAKRDFSNGKWTVEVSTTTPVHFKSSSGWQATLEEASGIVLTQLETLGEEMPA